MKSIHKALLFAITTSFTALAANAYTVAATYQFTNNLSADESGAPDLTPTDPLGQSGFLNDTVFGQPDTVYRFVGNASPNEEQAGLTLNATGLVTPDNYSIELIFSLDGTSGWRRVLDVAALQTDSGFYVDPGSHLDVFPWSPGVTPFGEGYHHVILTVAPDNTVKGYIDGSADFTVTTADMNLNTDANYAINFFLDNINGSFQGEYTSGNISLARLYDGVIPDAEATNATAVPEPALLSLLSAGGAALLVFRRRRS